MRSFDIQFLLFFLLFFILTSLGSFFNLRNCFPLRFRKITGTIFFLVGLSVFIGFTILYIYPFQPINTSRIPIYFYFNIVLFAFLVFNIPMSLALLTHLLFGKKRTPSPFSIAGTVISFSLALGMIYGAVIGSKQLSIEHHQVEYDSLPEAFNQFRVVQLSDVHIGGMVSADRFFDRITRTLTEIQPDLILFTGDLVNNFASELEDKSSLLRTFSSIAPSYSVLGNHDYGDYTRWDDPAKKHENFEKIIQYQEQAGIALLKNECIVIHRDGDSIFLAGVENWGHPPFPQYADLEQAINQVPQKAFTILMTHDPAHWESLSADKMGIDLTLSGHTHGMQWGIKLAGIPFSLASLTRSSWGGWYGDDRAKLYVNRGLGTVGMPWRLDMPPEITVITLKRVEID